MMKCWPDVAEFRSSSEQPAESLEMETRDHHKYLKYTSTAEELSTSLQYMSNDHFYQIHCFMMLSLYGDGITNDNPMVF